MLLVRVKGRSRPDAWVGPGKPASPAGLLKGDRHDVSESARVPGLHRADSMLMPVPVAPNGDDRRRLPPTLRRRRALSQHPREVPPVANASAAPAPIPAVSTNACSSSPWTMITRQLARDRPPRARASVESSSHLPAIAFHATGPRARMRPTDRRAAASGGAVVSGCAWSDARSGRDAVVGAGTDVAPRFARERAARRPRARTSEPHDAGQIAHVARRAAGPRRP